jgi:hypothetical protein
MGGQNYDEVFGKKNTDFPVCSMHDGGTVCDGGL